MADTKDDRVDARWLAGRYAEAGFSATETALLVEHWSAAGWACEGDESETARSGGKSAGDLVAAPAADRHRRSGTRLWDAQGARRRAS